MTQSSFGTPMISLTRSKNAFWLLLRFSMSVVKI